MVDEPAGGPDGTRFTDEEIQRILQRAADLQERRAQARALAPSHGLTLAELRDVANEAGIDPELVEVAAFEARSEAKRTPAVEGGGWVGSPRSLRWRLEQTVLGTLPPDRLDWVLRAIRSAAGAKGEVDHVSGQMEWRKEDGSVKVAIGTRGGSTRIEVTSDITSSAGGWPVYGALGVGFFGGGAVGGGALELEGILMVVCFVVMGLLGWVVGLQIQRGTAHRHEEYLQHLLTAATEATLDGAVRDEGGTGS
ncbi:MAG: hypothetical protein RJQ04_08570 [Longimicrobiales bacterium]